MHLPRQSRQWKKTWPNQTISRMSTLSQSSRLLRSRWPNLQIIWDSFDNLARHVCISLDCICIPYTFHGNSLELINPYHVNASLTSYGSRKMRSETHFLCLSLFGHQSKLNPNEHTKKPTINILISQKKHGLLESWETDPSGLNKLVSGSSRVSSQEAHRNSPIFKILQKKKQKNRNIIKHYRCFCK